MCCRYYQNRLYLFFLQKIFIPIFHQSWKSFIFTCHVITRYDTDNDGYLDIEDLKGMMMVRGVPWTHSAIVRLIRDADEDGDGKLSFREVSVFLT